MKNQNRFYIGIAAAVLTVIAILQVTTGIPGNWLKASLLDYNDTSIFEQESVVEPYNLNTRDALTSPTSTRSFGGGSIEFGGGSIESSR